MIKTLKALGALAVLVGLVAGIPVALWTFYGNPLPQQLPTLDDVQTLFTTSDSIGFLLFVLVWIGWLAWATFALSVLVEIAARIRHVPTPQLRGFGAQQGAAALLIATIAGAGAPVAMAAPTTDAPTPAQTTATAPVEATVTTAPTEADHTPQDTPAAPAGLQVTVQPGDTAWGLAQQHLGDGSRWKEIVEANDGVPQPDGGALHVGEDPFLEPGWQLTIPGVQAAPEAPQATDQATDTVTVAHGDSLSSIAAEHLGDSDRWPEIADASADIDQPGGHHLTDPDQIDVGWTLAIPHQEPAPAAPTEAAPVLEEAPQPAPAPDISVPMSATADAIASQHTATTTSAATEAAAAVVAYAAADEQPATAAPATEVMPTPTTETGAEAEESDLATWAGVGSVFAASLLASLVGLRVRSQRKRRAGQKIPAAATFDPIELTRIEDPTALAFVDRALRTLAALQLRDHATLPDIRLARLTDSHLELYAATSHQLPAPFEATEDAATWLLPRTAPLADDTVIDDIVAPYPALVTIGADGEGHQILVDLEHLAALGIHAAGRTSMPVMRALTVSLATSQWADDLAITTVGVCPELESVLGSGRIAYRPTVAELLDDLEAKLARDQQTLAELGHDSAQHARHAADATDAWTPEIIIIGTDLALTEQRRLQAIVEARPQIAVAVISSDQHADLSEWRMHIESLEAARLEPLGLEIRPQHLTDADYTAVLQALGATTTLEDVEDTAAVEGIDETAADETPTAQPVRLPVRRELLTEAQRQADPNLPTEHPYLRLLGTPEVLGATGSLEDKRLAELTETVVYIHLQPGTSDTNFRADLWAKPVSDATRHQRISRTRKWLDAGADGVRYLPRASGADGSYTLDERVTSDWDTIKATAAQLHTANDEQLAEALKLVRGAPLTGGGRTRYRWAITHQYTMIDTILDIALELAERALDAGDTATTLWATDRGLLAEPLHEQLWRYRLTAAADDPDLHQRITHDLEAQLTAIDDDYELSPETEALMAPTTPAHRIAI